MKKISILLVIAMIVVGGWYILNKSRNQKTLDQELENVTENKSFNKIIAPAGFQTYLDNKYGFQFIYPNELLLTEDDGVNKPGGFKSYATFSSLKNPSIKVTYSAGLAEGKGIDPSLDYCGENRFIYGNMEVIKHTWCNDNFRSISVGYKSEIPFILIFNITGKENFSLEQSIFDEILKTVKLP